MAGNVCRSEKYVLVVLIGALFIGTILGNPIPRKDDESNDILEQRIIDFDQLTAIINSNEDLSVQSSERQTSTTTTEHPDNKLAKLFAQPTHKMSSLRYASGVHKFQVGPNEDEDKRTLEEYRYFFERAEQNLPPTTQRSHFAPQRNF